tara:strand:+ start:1029 stop:1529 length:501 start_codon:yes stop_codon:yes gene_type:complete
MNYIKISIGIFLVLAASRFVPHPPNFTSLLALSFYVPALLGKRFIPALVLSFVITDLFIGFHNTTFFTWGSVVLIGLIVNNFSSSITYRITGSLVGAVIFFSVTNFGVWVSGFYGYTFAGLVNCYVLAIPFFAYSLISTLLFSSVIETLYFLHKHLRLSKYFNFKN